MNAELKYSPKYWQKHPVNLFQGNRSRKNLKILSLGVDDYIRVHGKLEGRKEAIETMKLGKDVILYLSSILSPSMALNVFGACH